MIDLDVKQILEKDTLDSVKEAIMKLAEEVEDIRSRLNNMGEQ